MATRRPLLLMEAREISTFEKLQQSPNQRMQLLHAAMLHDKVKNVDSWRQIITHCGMRRAEGVFTYVDTDVLAHLSWLLWEHYWNKCKQRKYMGKTNIVKRRLYETSEAIHEGEKGYA